MGLRVAGQAQGWTQLRCSGGCTIITTADDVLVERRVY